MMVESLKHRKNEFRKSYWKELIIREVLGSLMQGVGVRSSESSAHVAVNSPVVLSR